MHTQVDRGCYDYKTQVKTHYFLWYLKEPSSEDLEDHCERKHGALPTPPQVVGGRLAHDYSHPWILLSFSLG